LLPTDALSTMLYVTLGSHQAVIWPADREWKCVCAVISHIMMELRTWWKRH